MLKGFRQFILRGTVVDLAIAVVIGVAFNAVVQALVRDIVTPLIAAIAGKPNFNNLTFTVHHSTFHYGDLVNVIIAFLAIAAAVYFLVVAPMNAVLARRRGPQTDEAEVSEEVQILTEIRDLLARSGSTSS
ncbi:MAG: large conductance mechanosensitive channel protein MscL [Acidimicrobiales bacterium]